MHTIIAVLSVGNERHCGDGETSLTTFLVSSKIIGIFRFFAAYLVDCGSCLFLENYSFSFLFHLDLQICWHKVVDNILFFLSLFLNLI